MIIRQIQVSDASAFIGLNQRLSTETDFLLATHAESNIPLEKQEALIKAMQANQQQMVLVAEHEGALLGFIGVTRLPMDKVKHVARFAVGVLDDVKRQGIGSQLIGAAEAWLISKGISRIEMTVIANNAPAIAFYEKNGFLKEGVRRQAIFMNGRYHDEIFMAKIL